MPSDPIRLVSGEFRGQGNTSGSLTCFLALTKLFLQGSGLSLCRELLVRVAMLPYCMAMGVIGLQKCLGRCQNETHVPECRFSNQNIASDQDEKCCSLYLSLFFMLWPTGLYPGHGNHKNLNKGDSTFTTRGETSSRSKKKSSGPYSSSYDYQLVKMQWIHIFPAQTVMLYSFSHKCRKYVKRT